MKQDPYFKYLVVIILAGLVASFFDGTPAAATTPAKSPAVVTTASHGHKARS